MQRPTNYHNVYFLATAKKAAVQTDLHSPEIAIAFAAMSVEVFLNEIADLLMVCKINSKRVKETLSLLQLSVQKRASNDLKLAILYHGVLGRLPRTDSTLVTDLRLLFRLRNLILHSGPSPVAMIDEQDPVSNLPRLVKTFVSRGIIPRPSTRGSWNHYLLTRDVANWAVETALELRRHLASHATNREVRRLLTRLAEISESA